MIRALTRRLHALLALPGAVEAATRLAHAAAVEQDLRAEVVRLRRLVESTAASWCAAEAERDAALADLAAARAEAERLSAELRRLRG